MDRKNIVVVGGGAGGLELAASLGKKYGRKSRYADTHSVLLIDRNLTHVWKPLLHEVAAGALDSDVDGIDYRVQAANAGFSFQLGELCGLKRDEKTIVLAPILTETGEELVPLREFSYDILILAIGSVTNDYGTKGAAEHCFFLDSVKQANRFHHTLMNTILSLQAHRYTQPLDVAIVGGGATGVELAAELYKSVELIRSYGFEDFAEQQFKVTLVEAGARILPALPERIANAAQRELEKIGVVVRTETPITEVTDRCMITNTGEEIPARMKVWAAGVKAPNFLQQLDGLETNRANQIIVEPSLQSKTDDNIFVIGDCAACEQPDGSRVPPRAQAAHQMASHTFDNINRLLQQKTMKAFVYRDHGSLVSLSNYSTVGSLMGNLTRGAMMIEGFLARVVYKSLYRMHQVAIHGYFKTFLLMLMSRLNRRLRPRLKLH